MLFGMSSMFSLAYACSFYWNHKPLSLGWLFLPPGCGALPCMPIVRFQTFGLTVRRNLRQSPQDLDDKELYGFVSLAMRFLPSWLQKQGLD